MGSMTSEGYKEPFRLIMEHLGILCEVLRKLQEALLKVLNASQSFPRILEQVSEASFFRDL